MDDIIRYDLYTLYRGSNTWHIIGGTLRLPPDSGTTTVANPSGTTGDDLTRLSLDGTPYNIPEGTLITYRGSHSTTATYNTGDIVEVSSPTHRYWICINTTQANIVTPSTEYIPTTSGWVSLGTLHGFRGTATSSSVAYQPGDMVITDSNIYICVTQGSYTSAQIQSSPNWHNLTAASTSDTSDTSGITQANADNRYVELSGDTMTGELSIEPSGDNTGLSINAVGLDNDPAVVITIPTTGSQRILQAFRTGQLNGIVSLEGDLGGNSNKPGIAFGPGTLGRDVSLYREGANQLKTDDSLSVNELIVDNAGLSSTRENLGLGTAALRNWVNSDNAPSSPSEGDGWYDTANNQWKMYDGSIWQTIGNGSDGDTADAVPTQALLVRLNTNTDIDLTASWIETVSRFDTDDILINQTGWSRGTTSGNNHIIVPSDYDGTYIMTGVINYGQPSSGAGRVPVTIRSRIIRNGSAIANPLEGGSYARGIAIDIDHFTSQFSGLVQLEAGDLVNIEITAYEVAANYTIDANSYFALAKVGGTKR